MNVDDLLKEFINTLPDIEAFYGYGSGVIKQVGNNAGAKQLDGISVVENAKDFHIKNMKLNPNYYSLSAKVFFTLMPLATHRIGADICYIPYIKYKGATIKLGVIEDKHFSNDLRTYDNIYMAGRTQKEIKKIKEKATHNDDINYNRRSALIVSLMLLDENEHSLYDLYYTLSSLSYLGDIRRGITINKTNYFNFEHPNKINNIIAGSYLSYNDMYLNNKINNNLCEISDRNNAYFKVDKNLSDEEANLEIIERLKNIKININNDYLFKIADELPTYLKFFLDDYYIFNNNYTSKEDLLKLRVAITKYFEKVNRSVTIKQALKQLLITGLSSSVKYLTAKANKAKTKELRKI